MEQHYLKSSYREELIEHLFIGWLISLSWLKSHCCIDIAVNMLVKLNCSKYVQILIGDNSRGYKCLQVGDILTEAIAVIFPILVKYQIVLSFAKEDAFHSVTYQYFDFNVLQFRPASKAALERKNLTTGVA